MSSKVNKLPIRIRKATDEDVPFIFNSWLKSYRNSNFAKPIVNTVYFAEHHKIIESIVKLNDVLVACNNEDTSQVYGYCCAGRSNGIFVLHYIYVKHSFRGLGIGKALLSNFNHDLSHASVYTHHTRVADKVAPKYNMLYHPYIIYNPEYAKVDVEEKPKVEIEIEAPESTKES